MQSQSQQSTSVLDVSRANDELARRVSAYLASRSFHSFRDLQVSATEDVVTVMGPVASFHEKQVAYQSCRRVAGVREVVDEVYVAPPQFASQNLSAILADVDSSLLAESR